MNKYVGSFIGDGQLNTFEVIHNLGTMDLVFMVRGDDKLGNRQYDGLCCFIDSANDNVLRFIFKEPLDEGEKLIVTVIG